MFVFSININLIYSVDRIMKFNRAEPTLAKEIIFLRQFQLTSIHNTTPYIPPRLDSRIESSFSD